MKEVKRYINKITDFIDFLKGEEFIFIQTHNFPDHDAVASAFGLQQLFKHYGIDSYLVYEKEIQRDSLKKIIKDLKIDIKNKNDYTMEEQHKIVLVDGCKGNSNVTDLIGDEVGVIDHHQVVSPEDVEFSHIFPEYGACASIIASYFLNLGVKIPKNVATSFLIGISTDTSFLTRGVCEHDLQVFFHCYGIADIQYVTSILRNYIRISDLEFYRFLVDNMIYLKRSAFCYFPSGCNQNLLGILADFAISLNEIDFVVLCAKNENRINFSLRSEVPEWDASHVVRHILEGIGFGGGHADMAGGVIKDSSYFNQEVIYNSIISHLGLTSL